MPTLDLFGACQARDAARVEQLITKEKADVNETRAVRRLALAARLLGAHPALHSHGCRRRPRRASTAAGALPLICAQGEQTPLHLAAELDSVECVRVLLAHGANHAARDGQQLTPLLAACMGNCQAAARALIEAGALLSVQDEVENTPLHWLSNHDSVGLAELALGKGAEIDALNAASETPLLHAVRLGRYPRWRLAAPKHVALFLPVRHLTPSGLQPHTRRRRPPPLRACRASSC